MAMIRNLSQGVEMVLQANHIIGRHPSTSHLILKNPKASRMHATVTWNGSVWLLQDNSTNGTFINGTKLKRNGVSTLKSGDRISFVSADEDLWQVLDVSAPSSMLMPETSGTPLIILDNIAVLPDEQSPQIALYQSPKGDWFCESDCGTWQLFDGAKLQTGNKIWRFVEGKGCDETLASDERQTISVNDIKVHFSVSQNEEHVSMTIHFDGQVYDLGERNHHYLLLLLARQYLEDKAANFAHKERGWIDKELLERMLQQSEVYINMLIYRFRKQYDQLTPDNLVLPQLVERRKGEIRFICDNVDINGGFNV